MIDAMDTAVTSVAARMEQVHGPLWAQRSDFVRNVVTVGSGIFAGTVAFADRLLLAPNQWQQWFLVASWFLMLVSVAAGLLSLWHSVPTAKFNPIYFNNRIKLRDRLNALDPRSPTYAEDAASALAEVTNAALNLVGISDRISSRSARCSFFGLPALVAPSAVSRHLALQLRRLTTRRGAAVKDKVLRHSAGVRRTRLRL